MIPQALAVILHEKDSALTVKNVVSTRRHYFIPTGRAHSESSSTRASRAEVLNPVVTA